MKKLFLTLCAALVLTASAYSIDFEKAKKVIKEYSWTNQSTYMAVLADYGFTEPQMKAWRVSGAFIGNYIGQLQGILNGYGQPNPDQAILTIRNTGGSNGELSAEDLARIELFIRDMATVAIEIRDGAKAARDAEQKRLADAEAARQAEQKRRMEEDDRMDAEADAARAEQQEEAKRAIAQRAADRQGKARSLGLSGYEEGVLYCQKTVDYDRMRTLLIYPNDYDIGYAVQTIVDQYVVYSTTRTGFYQFALLAEKGKAYPAGSQFDIGVPYKVAGVTKFSRSSGGVVELIVLQRVLE